MTYDEIVDTLRTSKCYSTEDALDRAVKDEGRALREAGMYNYRDRGVASQKAAREFYAKDITEQLADPVEPTPTRMLNLRRFPTTWAVAEVIRTNTNKDKSK